MDVGSVWSSTCHSLGKWPEKSSVNSQQESRMLRRWSGKPCDRGKNIPAVRTASAKALGWVCLAYPWNTEGASDGNRVGEENTQGGDWVATSHSIDFEGVGSIVRIWAELWYMFQRTVLVVGSGGRQGCRQRPDLVSARKDWQRKCQRRAEKKYFSAGSLWGRLDGKDVVIAQP